MSSFDVDTIDAGRHLQFVRARPSASFLQTPAWGHVKSEWTPESIGWHRDATLVGAALVLYRRLPRMNRSLAYVPEGPLIDWYDGDLSRWLDPLVEHVRQRGAFAVRIGPPVPVQAWEAPTVKSALTDPARRRLQEVEPDERAPMGMRIRDALREMGWRRPPAEKRFGSGQPRYGVQVPLSGRSDDDLLAAMSQQWRRNIRRSAAAGVKVLPGGLPDVERFHRIYVETAARERFRPRPLSYFETLYAALEDEHPDRVALRLASYGDRLVAAAIRIRVGDRAWYAYGGSTVAGREARGSNALQWHLIREAAHTGASIYDLRGVTSTVDPDAPLAGLLRFKLGSGGRVVEHVGEWTLPVSRPLAAAFDFYIRRRARALPDTG